MWHCPTCGEEHSDSFDACWRCSGDHDGNRERNSDAGRRESIEAVASRLREDPTSVPSTELPTITYISIPLFISVFLVEMAIRYVGVDMGTPEQTPSPLAIAALCLAIPTIGVPVLVAMVRVVYSSISRARHSASDPWNAMSLLQMLSMFRLPPSICRSYRWFAPLYYGSLVAMLVAAPILWLASMLRGEMP